jgi:competence protein ComGF
MKLGHELLCPWNRLGLTWHDLRLACKRDRHKISFDQQKRWTCFVFQDLLYVSSVSQALMGRSNAPLIVQLSLKARAEKSKSKKKERLLG